MAAQLHLLAPKVILLGGLFQRDSIYAHAFRRRLKKNLPDARVATAERAPEVGAAWLAAEMQEFPTVHSRPSEEKIDDLAVALTEQRNPRSENLEKLSARQLVELFVAEEKFVQEALRNAMGELTRAVELATDSIRKGGRLIYVGAGTSGRLGVLDASEIPPTFGVSPEIVQGVIAGGLTALHRSVEGAEDEEGSGALAIDEREVTFVWGALARAKSLGAKTILVSCNPDASKKAPIDLSIVLAVGPEILAGSTRLKAGTATKLALNIISTGALVMLGKVRGNLMIDLHASSAKLRDRAIRVVAELAGSDYNSAREQLEASGWNLRAVVEKIET